MGWTRLAVGLLGGGAGCVGVWEEKKIGKKVGGRELELLFGRDSF